MLGRARRVQRQADRDWERGGKTEIQRKRNIDRKTHTNMHKERVLVTHWYSLISQASSLPGATLPWVAAFPTLGQDPQPFDPPPGTFCQKQLVSHKFLSSPPGIWSFIWPLNLWEAARGQAKPTNPWSLLTSSLPGSCPHRRWREGEHSAIESSL